MKKILAVVLTFAMILSFGFSVFADDNVTVTTEKLPDPVSFSTEKDTPTAIPDGEVIALDDTITSVKAEANAGVMVEGNVTGEEGVAIQAKDQSFVSVTGNITGESGILANWSSVNVVGTVTATEGVAVEAENGSIVMITNKVESVSKAVVASDAGTTLIVFADVAGDDGVCADSNAIVVVCGNIDGNNAIVAGKGEDHIGASVTVFGNVTGQERAIQAINDSTIIVEGLATGKVELDPDNTETENKGSAFLGELNGSFDDAEQVFYLLGLAKDSIGLEDITILTNTVTPMQEEIKTMNKTYWATVSAAEIGGTEISVKSAVNGKELVIDNARLPAGVTMKVENGVTLLSFDKNFKGGLQNLLLTLKDIVPDDPNVIWYPVFIPTVISLETEDSSLKDAAVIYEQEGHVGVTFMAEFAKKAGDLSDIIVKNEDTDTELDSSEFYFQKYSNGEVSLILSNSYLQTLIPDEYMFTITVGDAVFKLKVNVPSV